MQGKYRGRYSTLCRSVSNYIEPKTSLHLFSKQLGDCLINNLPIKPDFIIHFLNFMTMSILSIILAIFLPPLGVAMQYGLSKKFWINLILTLIGWLPGVIHAFVVLSK